VKGLSSVLAKMLIKAGKCSSGGAFR